MFRYCSFQIILLSHVVEKNIFVLQIFTTEAISIVLSAPFEEKSGYISVDWGSVIVIDPSKTLSIHLEI